MTASEVNAAERASLAVGAGAVSDSVLEGRRLLSRSSPIAGGDWWWGVLDEARCDPVPPDVTLARLCNMQVSALFGDLSHQGGGQPTSTQVSCIVDWRAATLRVRGELPNLSRFLVWHDALERSVYHYFALLIDW